MYYFGVIYIRKNIIFCRRLSYINVFFGRKGNHLVREFQHDMPCPNINLYVSHFITLARQQTRGQS